MSNSWAERNLPKPPTRTTEQILKNHQGKILQFRFIFTEILKFFSF